MTIIATSNPSAEASEVKHRAHLNKNKDGVICAIELGNDAAFQGTPDDMRAIAAACLKAAEDGDALTSQSESPTD